MNSRISFERVDLQAQTLYAELLQRVLADTVAASVEKLARAFVSKKIGRRTYWYLQHRQASGMKQTYLGPESPALLEVVERTRAAGASLAPDIARRRELCAAIRAMGFPRWPRPLVATLESLAHAGLFQLGAVLIGTPAYLACLTALGFRSAIATAMTGDIDLQVSAMHAPVDLSSALERVKLGYFPVPGLDPRRPSTAFKVRDGDLMVQFLTPGDEGGKPVRVEQLGTAAQPMPYLEYLAPEPMQAVLPLEAGILVSVPESARFAWHKLIVAANRSRHERVKSGKDIEQAADLALASAASDFDALAEAYADARGRGSAWQKKLAAGLARLSEQRPEAYGRVRRIVETNV